MKLSVAAVVTDRAPEDRQVQVMILETGDKYWLRKEFCPWVEIGTRGIYLNGVFEEEMMK